MKKISFLALLPLLSSSLVCAAAPGSATVILIKGTVTTNNGRPLQLKDSVEQGAEVKTGPKSFVKLLFQDNSQVNVGPESSMKIEPTRPGDPGLINLVGGQIRAKVTKDLLQGNPEEVKDKLLLKTKTAAMGIRGTDFQLGYNGENGATSLVTFEGTVAMVRTDPGMPADRALVENRDKVVFVSAGQYSGANPELPSASIPIKISPAQLETLKTNESLQGAGERSQAKQEAVSSPIPPGVDPKAFASTDKTMETALGKTIGQEKMSAAAESVQRERATGTTPPPPPEGFFDAKSGTYAPRSGGFVDLKTGIYVPPPPGSQFDPNTGVYVPPKAVGAIDPVTGAYVPPKGLELDAKKGFVAEKSAAAPGGAATAPGTQAPPPPAAAALADALNKAIQPTNAGAAVSFDVAFVPGMTGAPPPPPPMLLPGGINPANLPPPPDEPVSDPYCPTCQTDNVNNTIPQLTPLQFNITVQ